MFINEHIHPRIHEWVYNQMAYWLRYVLNTTDCDGVVDQTFDEILEQIYRKYVYKSTHDIYDNARPAKFTAPACNCLWDVLFNRLGEGIYNYTRI